MNKLVIFDNWKDLQNTVNEIGWENFKLYNSWKRNHAWKRNGHLVMNINVQNEDAIYLGYIYEDELSAIGNIYIENNEMWIGDFEVSKFKTHKGIGRLFFNAILEEFSNYSTITLTYLDTAARLFWEKMGFIGNDKNKIMTLDMNKKQIYESIMAKVAVQVKKAILESEEDSLTDIETKWSPREGLFKEKDPEKIVRSLVRSSKDYGQAMKRLTFYMNRAGKNLENKTVLNKAKKILHDKIENECIDESLLIYDYNDDSFEIRNRLFRQMLKDEGLDRIHLYQYNDHLEMVSDDPNENFIRSQYLFKINRFENQSIEDWIEDIKIRVDEARENLYEGECCPPPMSDGMIGPSGPGYNTPFNTIGVGNPVPPGPHHLGSGDLFRPAFPVFIKGTYSYKKKKKKSKRKSKK